MSIHLRWFKLFYKLFIENIPNLVESGLLWTNETPSIHSLFSISERNWQAHMEYLAFIFNISIITIGFVGTGKIIGDITANRCCITGKIQALHGIRLEFLFHSRPGGSLQTKRRNKRENSAYKYAQN